MFANLSGWHAVILVFIVLLLFGAPKLPALAKSLGQSMHILKKEIRPGSDAETAASDVSASTASGDSATQNPPTAATAQ